MSVDKEEQGPTWKLKGAALGGAALFAAACALGPDLGVGAHRAFLLGLGNLPAGFVEGLPWVS